MDRFFTTEIVNNEFVITEQFDSLSNTVSRNNAWDQARAQRRPVVFVGLDNARKELGVVYDVVAVVAYRRP